MEFDVLLWNAPSPVPSAALKSLIPCLGWIVMEREGKFQVLEKIVCIPLRGEKPQRWVNVGVAGLQCGSLRNREC